MENVTVLIETSIFVWNTEKDRGYVKLAVYE